MLDLLRRYGVLIAILIATLALYVEVTRPALARNAELAERERQELGRVLRLRQEALRMHMQVRALEAGDTAALERAVRGRFRPAADQTGLPSPALRGP